MKITATILMTILFSAFASAQQKIVPIIEMKVGGLLGGVSRSGEFVDAKTTAASLKGGENYALFNFKETGINEMVGGKPENDTDVCTDFYYVKLAPEPAEGTGGIAMGEGFRWNAVPRTAKQISLTDAAYTKIISDYIKTKKISNPKVRITQAFRVDLEGDGQEEVILTATRYTAGDFSDANAGDYSFVLLRKLVGKTVRSFLLEGEFYPKTLDFNAPNKYEVSAIADLNGDGKMEIVVHGAYYEGSGSGVYEMKGNRPVAVKALSVGCGV